MQHTVVVDLDTYILLPRFELKHWHRIWYLGCSIHLTEDFQFLAVTARKKVGHFSR